MSLTRDDQDARGNEAAAKQQSNRNEELQRIVEVPPEPIAAAAALGHQTQRQPHERAEGRLHGAEKHGGAPEQKQCKRGHALSISPSRRPPTPAQATLEPGHAAVIALVIIAEQVQQAM